MSENAESGGNTNESGRGKTPVPAPARSAATGSARSAATTFVHRTDLGLTVLILALCAGVYYVTTGFEEVSTLLSQNIPPEWFPRLLIWTIALLSLFLPFEHLTRKRESGEIDKDRSERITPMAIFTAILLALVVASIPLFGTLVAMVLGCVLLPLLWGERRMKVLIPYIVIFPTAVALLFTQVLKVYFEPGAFGPLG